MGAASVGGLAALTLAHMQQSGPCFQILPAAFICFHLATIDKVNALLKWSIYLHKAMSMSDDWQQQLYQRLLAYELHDPSHAIGFLDHLMRSNGWSCEYALRAIEDYRKFVFLAMVADHQVTPSDQIDQVWHLHLLFSDAYWNDFCPRVLGRPLHHEPARGGPQERERFHRLYHATLSSYRRHFGDPPLDLWPPADVRFGRDLQMQRGPIHPPFRPWRRLRGWLPGLSLTLVLALLLPLFAAPIARGEDGAGDGMITVAGLRHALWVLSVFGVTLLAAVKLLRPLLRRPARCSTLPSLDDAQLAYLANGATGVLQLELARLVDKGLMIPDVQSRSLLLLPQRIAPLGGLAHEMVAVHQRLAPAGSAGVSYNALLTPAHYTLAPLRRALQRRQLLLGPWARLVAQTDGNPAALCLAVWILATHCAVLAPAPLAALLRNAAFVPCFVGLCLALSVPSGRTLWGDVVLAHHQRAGAHGDGMRRIAVGGSSAMTAGRLDDLRRLIEGVASDQASSCGCGC